MSPVTPSLNWSGGSLPVGRPAVMAILNLTPDSFFDGGRYPDCDAAVRRAWQVVDEGADVLDIGGESTRPNAAPVAQSDELARVLPVLEALRGGARPYPLPISIDTTRSAVAEAALDRGAVIVNDVSAGLADPELLPVAAERGAAVVLMHRRGTPRTMQHDVHYDALLDEVIAHLSERCEAASNAGIPAGHQAVDPGIGFGKSAEGCLALLAGLEQFSQLNRPVLVGASRKSFLGGAFGHEGEDRVAGSLVAAACSVARGASIVRVHDVSATRRAVDVAASIRAAGL